MIMYSICTVCITVTQAKEIPRDFFDEQTGIMLLKSAQVSRIVHSIVGVPVPIIREVTIPYPLLLHTHHVQRRP